jgi:hypothetical protein
MTNDQINAAIAKAIHADEHWMIEKDYCADLNAMHEAERVLTKAQWQEFVDDLAEGWGSVSDAWKDVCHATARQRAEAFLRTIGEWEDAK